VKVHLDSDACVGHGRCYDLAPEVYAEDERGHCRLLHTHVPRHLEEQARRGAENCPESAIAIED
jgi:ferredoxin